MSERSGFSEQGFKTVLIAFLLPIVAFLPMLWILEMLAKVTGKPLASRPAPEVAAWGIGLTIAIVYAYRKQLVTGRRGLLIVMTWLALFALIVVRSWV